MSYISSAGVGQPGSEPPAPPYLLQEQDGHPAPAYPSAVANGETPLLGEITAPEEIEDDEEDNDHYEVRVRLRNMTWGDNMVHARFQLLIETIGDIDGEDSTDADRVAALRELVTGFEELTAFLERVARVTRNGERIPIKLVPMDFIKEVMDAISRARQRKASTKN